jgi:hypothetical protein
LEIYRNH